MDSEEDNDNVMTDADFERAMEQLREEGSEEVNELLMAMSENRIISWEEAERILGDTSSEPVKSSLPQQTRPTEPDNDTDVDRCVQRLANNDPKLVEINLNNMKRTPVPKVKRVIEAIRDNEYLEKLSLANMGLYDMDLQPLIDILEHNTTLRAINLETNYLSGDFFSRLFKAALVNQSLEEVKAVNQGVAFSTSAEREIIDAVTNNRGLTKVSINLRLPEGRFKVEQTTIRNQEIRRILRRQEAAAKAQAEAEAKAKGPPKLTTRPPKETETAKKKVGERKPSVEELAKQNAPSKLAVAGASQKLAEAKQTEKGRASTSATEEKNKGGGLRERAREAEKEAAKPREPKTAERFLLAEKLKEGGESSVAQKKRGWPPGGAKEVPKSEEVKGPPAEAKKDAKPKAAPSWREKMAQRDAAATKVKNNDVEKPNRELAKKESLDKDTKEAKESAKAAKTATAATKPKSSIKPVEKAAKEMDGDAQKPKPLVKKKPSAPKEPPNKVSEEEPKKPEKTFPSWRDRMAK